MKKNYFTLLTNNVLLLLPTKSILILIMVIIIGLFGNITNAQNASSSWPLTANANSTNNGNVTGIASAIGSGLINPTFSVSGESTESWSRDARSLQTNDYYEFKVTPDANNIFNVTAINFEHSRSSGNWQAQAYYSTDNFATSTSIANAFVSNSSTPTSKLNAVNIAVNNATLSVRVYGWESDGDNRSFRIRNFVISGTTCAKPFTAGIIAGAASVCQGQANVSYSVPAITNATSYTWVYSGTGATITGTTTSSPSITFAANATSGNLSVYGVNSCGNGTISVNYAITVRPTAQAPIIGTITPVNCANGTGSVVLNGLPAGSWVVTQSPGDTRTLGTGTSTTISGLAPGTYTFSVDNGAGLSGDYFNNPNLTGSPALTRTDATINFDWANASPDPLINNDGFSVRWTGQIQPLYSESYTFSTSTDDGIRLWVNGIQIINNWSDHILTTDTGSILLSAGIKYDIVLEYYERNGQATSKLSWTSARQSAQIIPQSQLFSGLIYSSAASTNMVINPEPTVKNPTIPAPTVGSISQPSCTVGTGTVVLNGLPSGSWIVTQSPGGNTISGSGSSKTISGLAPATYTYSVDSANNGTGLTGDYFNNMALTGNPTLTRTDALINFNWGSSTPSTSIPINNFSVRWSGYIQPLYSETYTFSTLSDDGIRLWVNGSQIINNWTDHSSITNTESITLIAGIKYSIRLEYYENQGDAIAQLSWSSTTQIQQIIPQSQLYPGIICSSAASEKAVINAQPSTPATPTSGGNQIVCRTSPSQTLTATATGETISWYDAATAGNLVNNPTLNTIGTVTYYAQNSNGSCSSLTRTPIILTINAAPAAPTSGGNQIVCLTTPIQTLTATATGGTIIWYDAASAGNLVSNPTLNTIGTVTYYAQNSNGSCSSLTRTPVILTINAAPAPTSGGNQIVCQTSPIQILKATAFGGTISWYDAASAGNSVSNPTLNTVGTITYYAQNLNGSCSSLTRTPVILIINAAPIITTQPTTPMPTCFGSGTQTMTVLATGTALTYKWRKGNTDLVDGGVFSGINTASLTLTNPLNADAGEYKVTVTGSCGSLESNPITVIVYGKTWNGSSSSDWNTPANWTPAAVPTANDCVLIPSLANKPILASGSNATAYKLLIQSGGDLSINSGFTITLIDKLTVATGGKFLLYDSASLVQINSVTNSGTATILRITKPMYRYDYTYWSSPVANFSLGGLSPLTSPSYYMSWNPTINGGSGNWKTEGTGTKMITAVGYAVRAPQSFSTNIANKQTYTATFVGVPNNGDIPITIYKGSNANILNAAIGSTPISKEDDEWNLIGNPYPSGLNVEKFLDDNATVLNGTIYLWTHNSPPAQANKDPFYGDFVYNYAGADYATFNKTGFVDTKLIVNGGKVATLNIASGQSFFVKALTTVDESTASTKTATFTNDMRVGTTNATFFKQAAASKTSSIEKNRLWLNLTNSSGAFSQTLVGYVEGATIGIDRDFDGQSFGGNFVSFYSVRPEMNLTIQGRPLPFETSDLVALGYKATIKGSFSIRIDHLDGFFETQNTYLEDKLTNTIHDLKASPYVFSTEIGTFDNRFVLRYTSNTLANTDFVNANNLTALISNKEFHVSASQAIEEIEIYELTGKLIQTQQTIKSRTFKSDFPFAKGIYIAKIKLENGLIISKKLMN